MTFYHNQRSLDFLGYVSAGSFSSNSLCVTLDLFDVTLTSLPDGHACQK